MTDQEKSITASKGDVQSARPPFPPFTRETAIQKVRLGEDGWNSRDPQRVSLAYTPDSRWRNRSEFLTGRAEIVAFLTRKWAKDELRETVAEFFSVIAVEFPAQPEKFRCLSLHRSQISKDL